MSFGRFERSQVPQPMSEINMTPLIDVMLVLVVIFIITAPLLTSAIKLELPKAQVAAAADAAAFVTISVDPTGQVFLNNHPLALSDLPPQLLKTAQRSPQTEVRLRADASVPYGRIAEVMAMAQKAGLNRIGFVIEPVAADLSAVKP